MCVLIPLGSPSGVPNWSYVHVPEVPRPWSSRACRGRAVPVWYQGGYTGWVAGWVIRGHPARPLLEETTHRRPVTAGNGPTPAGGRWVGCRWVGGRTWETVARGRPCTHPPGPVSPPAGAFPGAGPCRVPPRRDSTSFPVKLVKRPECHRKVMKRPTLVPNSQNGSGKSPLEIPGIPFWLAFSHKELMGYFGAY